MADAARLRTLPLFFFGTLMDGDVLAQVIERPVDPDEFAPALLWDHRRHAVAGVPYPVIRPHRDCHVRGALFQPRDVEELARIDHFESEEYEPGLVRVQAGTRMVDALCYVDIEGVFAVSEQDWSLHRFCSIHKTDYLRACRRWMADYAAA